MSDRYECPPDHAHAANTTCRRHHGCGCAECRSAAALRRKTQRRQAAYGRYRGATDACGAIRRVQGLMYLGWRLNDIAAVLGHSPNILHRPRSTNWITPETHDSIVHAFEVLMRRGQGPSQRTVNIARKRGYVSPLAWDNIDDPDETPDSGRNGRLMGEELIAEIEWLVTAGVAAHEIAKTLNKTRENLERFAWRHQRNDLATYLRERNAA